MALEDSDAAIGDRAEKQQLIHAEIKPIGADAFDEAGPHFSANSARTCGDFNLCVCWDLLCRCSKQTFSGVGIHATG